MIHLNNITRQHGAQILFQNASFQITPGSRSGLVGPNGAGKTTIFRLITGEEQLDSGEITCGKKTVIGYFSQDVGEMSGRSALAEVMAASARTMQLGEEIRAMEAAMCEPMADDALAALLERYGDAQEEFEHRGGYDLESRAQAVLTGLGIGPDDYDRPVESFSGGWKMRIALAKILTINPDVLLLDEPTNHLDVESIVWLEELAGDRVQGGAADDQPRPRLHEPPGHPDHRGGQRCHHHLRRQLRFLPARAGNPPRAAAGQPPPPAGDAGQGGGVHRPLRRPGLPCRAGAVTGQEAREDRADRNSRRTEGDQVRVCRAAAQRRRCRARIENLAKTLAAAGRRRKIGLRRGLRDDPARREDRRGRGQRCRQVDLPQSAWPARPSRPPAA